ncbi:heterokaryon incompatibility protein [Fusarium subglutinans]|uniref:Heterokaryon incompatibility protein n=1 Tax=Gibberella subglutinans TaxID=42677 RepID=A0A8H5QDA2_GIBSU|nr:heterokaryon incompatibility protein [Fusarium subglutinans]KAF5611918.1 heterokaryon incompatibility protein [Fusarium subglutinans]
MDRSNLNNYHITIVAPSPEDYETARALLDEPDPEYYLTSSGAACSLGKVGPHNVVLVGKAEDMADVSVFVKDTVDALLEVFPFIRAGFLIGVDGTVPEESPAKVGDIVVAFPQGSQPGQVQFDVSDTIASNHISTTFEMSHPSSYIKSVINIIQFPEGRQHWGQYLQHQSPRAEVASTKDLQPPERNTDKANKVLRGKVASSTRLLSDCDLANKIGCDNKIMCFERAAATIKSRFPILTICGIVSSTDSCSPKLGESALRQIKMATVIYTMFVSHHISTAKLEDEYAFTDRYQYEPFDLESAGFRLVLLKKGVRSQLRCQLWQAYLNDNDIIPYEALSYTWESQSTPHEIIVDEKILPITESLYEALCHLRRPDADRMLWIDALCIDQTNIKERGHQVNRMGEIYKKADKVIVWLGYLSGNATQLKSAITMLEAQVAQLPGVARGWPREDPRWKSQWRQIEDNLGPFCRDKLVDGLESFMEKPWFSRVWILQEVANAKKIIVTCNLGEIPGWIFALLPHAMEVKVTEQFQAVLDIMPHPLTPSASRKETRNLSNLLWKFRGCKATDPRDRVYALLGMATDRKESAIQPDYAKEEHMVMKDLYAYILGGEWPVYDSPASNIQDLQQKLPDMSRRKLQQMLQSTFRTDLLEHFLCRQSLISMMTDDYLFNAMHHGSSVMQALLDKSTPLPDISLDLGLECLQRFPDVFEVLLRRPDCNFENMPRFVARAIQCRPQLFERLVKSHSDPVQLRHDALLRAILRWRPVALRSAILAMKGTFELEEDLFITSINYGPRTLKCILAGCTRPFNVTKKVYGQAVEAGVEILSYLFPESSYKLTVTESSAASSIIRICEHGIDSHSSGFFNSLHGSTEYKLQITDELMSLAKQDKLGIILPMISRIRKREKDVSDEVAISAIQCGPEAFMALLNKRGTNFRVTKRIREVAIKHSYAFEALGLRRHSEVFTESLNLDQCVLPGMQPPRPAHMDEVQAPESTNRVAKWLASISKRMRY